MIPVMAGYAGHFAVTKRKSHFPDRLDIYRVMVVLIIVALRAIRIFVRRGSTDFPESWLRDPGHGPGEKNGNQ